MMNESSLPSNIILRRGKNRHVTDRWCIRLVQACDGHLTLEEVAAKLHLNQQIVQKLAKRALHEHWLEPADIHNDIHKLSHTIPAAEFKRALYRELQTFLEKPNDIMTRALDMARIRHNALTLDNIHNLLLAIELCLPPEYSEKASKRLRPLEEKYQLLLQESEKLITPPPPSKQKERFKK